MLWYLGYYKEEHPFSAVPADFEYPNPKQAISNDKPSLLWLNHSSFFVTYNKIGFLTDPIWNERCSPFHFVGPKRRHPPPLPLSQLPCLDFVLISHNHYDHLDRWTVEQLSDHHPDAVWVVPLGLKSWLRKWGVKNVVELDWWERVEYSRSCGMGCSISAVPAQHYSGRSLFDFNQSLWAGWVVELFCRDNEVKRFYYAGDTGYNAKDFKRVGEQFGEIDLSLIPIGVYSPKKFMRPIHVEPEEAVLIHQDVNSKLSVAAHWKTFKLSDESPQQPPYDLYRVLENKNIPHRTFRVLDPGQWINW
ncbi:MBL fold metallo-hydrolase [Simkania negevensis]|uniref:MBL fold metallo-hydrolase n=1 Tax=Simkania negevensis TaxID=83561 RepID=A0ABS3AQ83_9BACT|nr:MBL fold metallo-hydrolase [Simkania negevensis]